MSKNFISMGLVLGLALANQAFADTPIPLASFSPVPGVQGQFQYPPAPNTALVTILALYSNGYFFDGGSTTIIDASDFVLNPSNFKEDCSGGEEGDGSIWVGTSSNANLKITFTVTGGPALCSFSSSNGAQIGATIDTLFSPCPSIADPQPTPTPVQLSNVVGPGTYTVTAGPSDTGVSLGCTVIPPYYGNTQSAGFLIDSITLQDPLVVNVKPTDLHFTQAIQDFGLTAVDTTSPYYNITGACDGSPNCPIDLVLNKTVHVSVKVTASGTPAASGTVLQFTLPVNNTQGNKIDNDLFENAPQFQNIPIQDVINATLDPNKKGYTVEGNVPLPSSLIPGTPLTASLHLDTFDLNGGSNESVVNKVVRVKQSTPFGIAYVPMQGIFGTFSDPEFLATEKAGHLLTQAVFPEGDTAITAFPGAETIPLAKPSPSSTLPLSFEEGVPLIMKDFASLLIQKYNVNASASNVIGIVPQDYLKNHGVEETGAKNPSGLTDGFGCPGGLPRSFVQVGSADSIPHELGHQYQLCHSDAGPISNIIGYWVTPMNIAEPHPPTQGNFTDLMSETAGHSNNDINDTWINATEYGKLFNNLKAPGDPAVVLISGLVGQNGSITLNPTLYFPDGIASSFNSTQSGVVQALGPDGTVVAKSSFEPSFGFMTSDEDFIPTKEATFEAALPISTSAVDAVQVLQNGRVLASFNPMSQLLLDTIRQIPNDEYLKKPEASKRKLLDLAMNIERTMNLCNRGDHRWISNPNECSFEVLRQLLNLREVCEKELIQSTAIQNPNGVTKQAVLNAVDVILLQNVQNRDIGARERPQEIRVLPRVDQKDGPVLSITAVTQGKYGAVEIGRDGISLVYYSSVGRKADSFTFTVTNPEGISATRTVTLEASTSTNEDEHN